MTCPLTGKPCHLAKIVHITEINDGKVESINLCPECVPLYVKNGLKTPEPESKPKPKKDDKSPAEFLQDMLNMVEDIIDDAKKNPKKETGKEIKINILPTPMLSSAMPEKQPCPTCGITVQDIAKHGKLGCPGCYQWFEQELALLLFTAHSMPHSEENLRHKGKVPKNFKPPQTKLSLKHQLVKLNFKMAKAVQQENYEEAAILRDAILALKEQDAKEQEDKKIPPE